MTTNLTPSKAIAAVALFALSGCAANSPNLDLAFGKSFSAVKAQQIINPYAQYNNTSTATLDGRAAHEVLIRYNDSFKAPPPQGNVFTIGVGGSK